MPPIGLGNHRGADISANHGSGSTKDRGQFGHIIARATTEVEEA
jgi:hypothetical protein